MVDAERKGPREADREHTKVEALDFKASSHLGQDFI